MVHSSPVRKHSIPQYPTREQVLEHPDLLSKHIPCGWLTKPQMGELLGLCLAIGGAGCSTAKEPATTRAPAGKQPATIPASIASQPVATSRPAQVVNSRWNGRDAIVAPLFEHGNGRGTLGCVVVTPPVCLSEEEAAQVICEEFQRNGIAPGNPVTLKSVKIPLRFIDPIPPQFESDPAFEKYQAQPLTVDVASADGKVLVEFVSAHDYAWRPPTAHLSTVSQIDFKEQAEWLRDQVKTQAKGFAFGVFYDPAEHIDLRDLTDRTAQSEQKIHAAAEKATTEAKRLLRLQVKDFVDWLKAQGAI